ncbi:MAG: hypothetical protein OEM15_03255 [Myxococcales bacterium]|nr:hypothetical protein [Myxococcales bacterium]MDH3485364.1 hypothetical protein [Myxococcales bacterium]
MTPKWTIVGVLIGGLLVGCTGDLNGSEPRNPNDPNATPETKRIVRLSADQFFRSLEVTTGQTWSREDQYAPTLGKPDFDQATQESQDISVSFVKLAGDAAREVCGEAVDADLEMVSTDDRIILKHVDGLDPEDDSVLTNLRYLVLRFHGIHMTDDLDSRLDPWAAIMRTDLPADQGERESQARDRWKAVCVGLITHPDFLTY